jgi:8-oxo-dGTP pyrophosphatase MutT (NUDIX family)
VRVVLHDAAGALLLVQTRDPARPGIPAWWELPGGGLHDGEDVVAAAVREIGEETGLLLDRAAFRPLPWRRSARYLRDDELVVQLEQVLAAVVAEVRPETSRSRLTAKELAEVVSVAWWPPERLATDPGPFWPRRLPELLPAVMSGSALVESVEDRLPQAT